MLLCALMLAMSTLDTLMNGLVSGMATDLAGSELSSERSFTPKPDLISPMVVSAPTGWQMFWSFALALVISSAITVGVVILRRITATGNEYDFDRPKSEFRLIDEPAAAYH